MSVALQVLAELKYVLKQDAGLELNVSKTSILPKGVTAQAAFDVAQNIIQATPTLAHLSGDVLLASFCPKTFVGIGVPIVDFSVTFNDVTKDAAFYTTTSRFVAWLGAFSQERQGLWLPKDDLQDSSSWSSSPLLLLRDIHSNLLTQYNCKEGCAPSQSQAHVGTRGALSSQDGVSQQQEDVPLSIPQLNHLHETSCGERTLPTLLLLPSRHRIGSPFTSDPQHAAAL